MAEASLKFGLMALDVAVSLSPNVWAKDTYESITGNSIITGEELGAVGRGAAIIGVSLAIGLAFIAPEAVPMVRLLAKIIRKVDKGEKFEKAKVAAGKLEKSI